MKRKMKKELFRENLEKLRTCFLCTFPPRDCGIASFTNDLSTAMDRRFNPKLKSSVIAMNEEENQFDYTDKVISNMTKDDIEHYLETAKRINESENIKIVCIQHEFGLFGGEYGAFLIPFLEILKKPKVVVFHTVLPEPDDTRRKIVKAIASRVSAIIVIAKKAIDILENDYGIEKEKIHLVHHGIPNVQYQNQEKFKEKFGLQNKIVLSTHGLISRGKGIEYSIKALPSLVEKYPNLLFLVIGETHPFASKEAGEDYRKELENLVRELNLENNVRFINEYVPLKELLEYIQASDVYVFTNLEKAQISSGTLCRAMGCGRAIVSTPITYAEELLASNRGILVEFKNPESFTSTIDNLISDPNLRKTIEKNAYFFTRQMIWSNVALSYLKIFNKIVKLRKEITEKLPKIKLDHLKRLTDSTGIIQFAKQTQPEMEYGYTLDDNSRALISIILYQDILKTGECTELTENYLNFLKKLQEKDGYFKNQYKNKEEITNPYSEDAFGRAIWALGFTINKSRNENITQKAKSMFIKSFLRISEVKSPRAIAFSIKGLYYYYKKFPNRETYLKIKELANRLIKLYEIESSKDWQWFESYLTYANAKLPESLFFAYRATGDMRYLETAKRTLKFLTDQMIINGKFNLIGQRGWFIKNNERAFFDQQPIDASAMVQALLTAHFTTGNKDYYDNAILAFNWFLGHNHLNQMIYDETTGGCFDGLGKNSLNFNQGAESTISYLIARLFMEESKKMKDKKEENNKKVKDISVL
ncbi:glycosyltransferase [Candidatus Pacearchaeota archaeon]|nr:glycosyltransferase [Candidatus Pacearchaeota archaeon]MBD3283514.1 glycosyltransferase [Candidatus Pacearchaeota archaeon]